MTVHAAAVAMSRTTKMNRGAAEGGTTTMSRPGAEGGGTIAIMTRMSGGRGAAHDQDEEDYDDEPHRRRERVPPERLRAVAIRQKILIFCILGYVVTAIAGVFVPADVRPFLAVPAVIVVLAAAVFVFLLAVEVHGTGLGIVFGLLTFLPCLGLIVLLIVNQTATSMLQRNRVRVGLLGANMSDIRY